MSRHGERQSRWGVEPNLTSREHSVLARPWHCGIAALFREMLHHNLPKGSQGRKERNKYLLQNVRKHKYIYVHFLII